MDLFFFSVVINFKHKEVRFNIIIAVCLDGWLISLKATFRI